MVLFQEIKDFIITYTHLVLVEARAMYLSLLPQYLSKSVVPLSFKARCTVLKRAARSKDLYLCAMLRFASFISYDIN